MLYIRYDTFVVRTAISGLSKQVLILSGKGGIVLCNSHLSVSGRGKINDRRLCGLHKSRAFLACCLGIINFF
jgi:hypothetical protein